MLHLSKLFFKPAATALEVDPYGAIVVLSPANGLIHGAACSRADGAPMGIGGGPVSLATLEATSWYI